MSDLNLETTLTANAGPLNAALQSGGKAVQDFGKTAEASSKAVADADRGVTNSTNARKKAMEDAVPPTRKMGEDARKAAEGVDALGISSKQTAAAMRGLPAQMTDIATQLAGGQNPLLILLQQGGQIKDQFGGIGPTFRALGGLITPVRLALGGAAAAAGALTMAWYQGREEAKEYAKSLILTGNAAGTTKDQMADMARAVSSTVGTQGKAAEVLALMAGSGSVARADLQKFTTTAIQMERVLGVAVEDTADKFAALAKEPLAASLKLNQGTNYLTASVYEQIRALVAQGKAAEAASLAQNTFADAMASRTEKVKLNLGYLETAWKGVTDAAKKTWDIMVGAGREGTLEEQLAKITKKLADARKTNDYNKFAGQTIPGLEADKAALEAKIAAQKEAAEQEAAQTEKNQKELREKSAAHQAAQAAIAKAGAARTLAETTVGLARQQAALELAFQRDEVSARDYQAKLLKIELSRVDAQVANIERLKAAEASRKPENPEDTIAQQAALVQLDAQRIALQERRVKLLSDEARGLRDVAPKARSVGPADDLRNFKAKDEANVDAGLRERTEASRKVQAELIDANKAMNLAMIRDDRERGFAQIAAEEEQLRKRLDLAALSVAERQAAEDDLATWRLNREKQLTDSLKPEWERMLESWRDTTRQMKESYDGTVLGVLREGEAAWVRFAQTGKLSVTSLVNEIIAQQARQGFRQFAGFAANLLGNYFGAGSLAGATGFGDANASAILESTRAAGGPVDAGKTYLVGERGPELLRLGQGSGTVVPNGAMGGGAINITVVNQTGQAASASATRKSDGSIELLLRAVEEGIAGNVAAGTGPMASALHSRYGLRASFGT